ncbi:2'-5' RNA ligase family protein [Polyangium jinanense]|uniref:2'-5' RNA ligase family protein n=1 Tax=Polyangium jinanense TaxID=2829994 RepID=A0A9X3XB12_9BACT|nr:2'-5' RNA ligase family protein [Polyangium jinanense]MDC3960949.1 2'-5' RNA ligase family protein [Polyangium jinanense]MDC3987369.1 2'-5' RNA ligase family protein [Polyangium jinanense]
MKTHWTAAVLVPPPESWEPIQAIRKVHDRKIGRWMPHVTLLYPFRPRVEFDALAPALAAACAEVSPFTLTLRHFGHFQHGRGRFTVWLDPEPHEPILALHAALVQVVPDCDDTARPAGGFKPHLSVGQANGDGELARFLGEVESTWMPIAFKVHAVALIAREGEAPFVVERWIPFGMRQETVATIS